MPYMQFLFVRLRLCFMLPSDFASRRTPCPKLTVPTSKSVVDFHHQVIAHAEHTPSPQSGHIEVLAVEQSERREPRAVWGIIKVCTDFHMERTVFVKTFQTLSSSIDIDGYTLQNRRRFCPLNRTYVTTESSTPVGRSLECS